MSTTIDQQVVEMRFDNQHFEKNVRTSMSTLDRLKQSLNLTGASKGLENINAAAKNNNFGALGQSVEAVKVKFSALQVMGVTALTNITNSAVNAGKRMVKALTIEPVTTGFKEYELKMGSIQTIMASTGESLDTVNRYLNELNEYSDKTIYSFSDMTQNIGKFTNAGVKLEDAVMAIKGISNEAALSGANANEASRAMYNFAQALSAGYVKLIDWKSIENANMATVGFKEQLLEAAVAAGTVKKTADGMYKVLTKNNMGSTMDQAINATKNFNDSLSYQWMTTEVLVSTLKDYANEETEIGKKATQAATEVKTFTQMMDALKESAQSGWAQTWEIVFGDFYQGKELWTTINDVLGGLIGKMDDVRNSFLRGALGSKWDELTKKIEKAGFSAEDFNEILEDVLEESGVSVKDLTEKYGSLGNAIKKGKVKAEAITKALKKLLGVEKDTAKATNKVTTSVKDLETVAKRVINGEFGNGEKRLKALTEAGYDYATVQNKVNEILGSSKRYTSTLTEAQKEQVKLLSKLSDEQLKNQGYTEDQIKALRELQGIADDTGSSIDELIKSLEQPTGRELLIESFKNMWEEVKKIFETIGKAWATIFGKSEDIDAGKGLYNLIQDFHDLTSAMNISEDSLISFQSIVEGILATSKLGTTIISKSVLSALKLLDAIFKVLGTDMLTVAGQIGDKLVEFSNWLTDKNLFGYNHFTHLANILIAIYEGVKRCVDAFLGLEKVQAIVEKLKLLIKDLFGSDSLSGIVDFLSPEGIIEKINTFFTKIETWIKGGNQAENLGIYIIQGLINGMIAMIKGIYDAVMSIVSTIISIFTGGFDINSPSRVMMTIGGFIIAGLIAGMLSKNPDISSFLTNFVGNMIDGFKSIVSGIGEVVKQIDFGKLVAIGLSGGLIYTIKQLTDALELFGSPLKALTGMFDGFKKGFLSVTDALAGAIKLRSRVGAIKNMAISIAILAGSLWVLSQIDEKRIWPCVGVVAALSVLMVGLAVACEKLNAVGSFGLNSASIAAIALSLLAIAGAFKLLSTVDPDRMDETIVGFMAIIGGFSALLLAFSKLTKNAGDINFKGFGKVFTKMAWAMLLMVGIIKLASMLTVGEIIKGTIAIGLVGVLFRSIVAVTEGLDFRAVDGTRKLITRLSLSLLLMVGVIKIASMLAPNEIVKGTIVIGGITAFFWAVVKMSESLDYGKGVADHISAAGNLILKLSAAMILIGIAIKIIAGIDSGLGKALGVITAVTILLGALVGISKFSGEHAHKAGLMLIEFSVAMLLLAAVLIILKELDPDGIGKALTIMAGITVMLGALIGITKLAEHADKAKGILISLTVAIGVMALAIIAMSFLDSKKVAIAAAALGGVIGMFTLLIKATTLINSEGKGWLKSLGVIAGLAIIVGGLAYVIKDLAELEPDRAVGAAVSLGVLLVTLSSSLWILSHSKILAKSNLANMFGTIGFLSLIAIGLGGFISDMNGVDPTSAISTAVATGILLNAMSSSLLILSHSKSISKAQLPKIISALMALSGVTIILAAVIKNMNACDPVNAIGSAIALSVLLLAMSKAFDILASSKSLSKADAPRMLATIGVLALIMPLLGEVIKSMNDCNPITAIGTALALGLLMDALAVSFDIIAKSKSIKPNSLAGIVVSLTMMCAVMAVAGEVIKAMKDVNPLTAIGSAIALSILVGTLTLLLNPLAAIGSGPMATNAVKGVLVLTSMVIPLATFAFAVSKLPDLSGKEGTIMTLTLFMTAMTLLLIPLTLIGFLWPGAAIGIVALTAMVVPLAALSSELSNLPDLSGQMGNINTMMRVMESLTRMLVMVSSEGLSSLVGISAIDGMVDIVTKFGVLATTIGGFMDMCPDLQSFLDTGLKVLEQVAEGLGTALGGFVTSFAGEIFDELPGYGAKLTAFMLNAMAFVTGIKMVDEKALTGAKNLAESISALLVANLLDNLTFFGSLPFLGLKLSMFAENARGFFTKVEGINASSMQGVKYLTEAILNLTKAELIDNINNFLGGGLDLGEFGTQLAEFGDAIVAFNDSVSGTTFNTQAIEAAKAAGEIMLGLQDAVAPMGGVVQAFTGQKNLGYFGQQLEEFGTALVNFSNKVSAEGAIDTTAIQAAQNAGTLMTTLQDAVNPVAGIAQAFTGTTDLATFGRHLILFGQGVVGLSNTLQNEGNGIDSGAIEAAAKAGTMLAEVQKAIPEDKIFDGKISIDDFGTKISAFGTYIAAYAKKVADIDPDAVSRSTLSASALVTIAKNVSTLDPDGIDNFSAIKKIGEGIKNYYDKVSDIDPSIVSSSITSANRLKNLITNLVGLDTSGVDTFKSAVDSLGTTNVNSIVSAFDGATGKLNNIGANLITAIANGMQSKQSGVTTAATSIANSMGKTLTDKAQLFATAGKTFMINLIKGINDQRTKVEIAVSTVVKSGATKAREYYTNYYNAGKYVVTGFADGITANTWKAEARAKSMAKAAEEAAKDELKINSPSKVFAGFGSGVVEGFVKGIHDNASQVVSSSSGLADSARAGFSRAIGKVSDLLNGGMDTQPTIRPVLDLSDVQSGAATIGSMFGSPSVGVMSNLGAINTTMNRINQNGTNDDIIDAIYKLGKHLDNVGGTNYNINGISYSSGSEVSDAIETLVRATRMERRV